MSMLEGVPTLRVRKEKLMSNLDTALQAAAVAEATFNSDVANVANIEVAISTASAPLVAAQAQLVVDAQAFNDSLDNVSTVALASKVPVPVPTQPAV